MEALSEGKYLRKNFADSALKDRAFFPSFIIISYLFFTGLPGPDENELLTALKSFFIEY